MQHPTIYNFAGAAKALLELAMLSKYRASIAAQQQHTFLLERWNQYYKAIIDNQSCPLKLRAQGLSLANQCANFARSVCGAESILSSHPINRINREIWQYSVAGYSQSQLEAYLEVVHWE